MTVKDWPSVDSSWNIPSESVCRGVIQGCQRLAFGVKLEQTSKHKTDSNIKIPFAIIISLKTHLWSPNWHI